MTRDSNGKRPWAARVRRAGRTTRVAVVASAFNKPVTAALVRGARVTLQRHGITANRIACVWVPGAFELPAAAAALAASKARPDAIVAVGCIIKGQTPQYAALGQAVLQGLAQVSVQEKIPVGCGVVIADSVAQARARAARPGQRPGRPPRRSGRGTGEGAVGNRGEEAALAALAMVDVMTNLNRAHA